MKRWAVLSYGVACYAMFLGVFVALAAFMGNISVPWSMDTGTPAPLGRALMVDLGLVALFGLQHSIMARPAFKGWWTRIISPAVERSTYVLASNLAVLVLMFCWQPSEMVAWELTSPALIATVHGFFILGMLIVLASTFQINHFDLFGLRQVWLYFQGKEYTPVEFRKPLFYRYVRHPLYVGWLLATWSVPTMSLVHLAFSTGLTAYILIAIPLEERDLVDSLGRDYRDYQKAVPMLIPGMANTSIQSEMSSPQETA